MCKASSGTAQLAADPAGDNFLYVFKGARARRVPTDASIPMASRHAHWRAESESAEGPAPRRGGAKTPGGTPTAARLAAPPLVPSGTPAGCRRALTPRAPTRHRLADPFRPAGRAPPRAGEAHPPGGPVLGRAKITVKSARCARALRTALPPLWTVIFLGTVWRRSGGWPGVRTDTPRDRPPDGLRLSRAPVLLLLAATCGACSRRCRCYFSCPDFASSSARIGAPSSQASTPSAPHSLSASMISSVVTPWARAARMWRRTPGA